MQNQNQNQNIFQNFSGKDLYDLLSKNNGLFGVNCKLPVRDKTALSLVYSPGVGASCKEIQKDLSKADFLTNKSNAMILITDTSGLDNKDPSKLTSFYNDAILPYLESICLYYKKFGNIDCYPVIFDIAYLSSELDLIETLDALMPSYSLVELFLVKSSKYQLLTEFINNITIEKRTYAIIGKNDKRKMDNELNISLNLMNLKKDFNLNLDYLNSNFIYTCIIRAALDLKAFTALDECVEYILKLLRNLFCEDKIINPEELRYIQNIFNNFHNAMDFLIHKSCEYLIDNTCKLKNLINEDSSKKNSLIQETRKRFLNFSLMGKSAWIDEYPVEYFSDKKSINENSILLHWRYRGVIETASKLQIEDPEIFSKIFDWKNLDFISELIQKDQTNTSRLTYKSNYGAIITNGTAILGYGDIGALAGLPVMEGKSVLFKLFGGLNIMPLCIQEKEIKKFISIVQKISPSFSVINLEDIKAPDCFEIETSLIEKLPYPVFHDDQHGTAIVVLSGIINSLKLSNKNINEVKIVMNGAGAAGVSVCDLLLTYGAKNIIVCDTTGAIYSGRKKNMNSFKEGLASKTNLNKESGDLKDVIKNADIFIGVSAPKTLTQEMIKSMANKPIIFALANPEPEIFPSEAYKAGAFIVATGRSDMKNQVNNSLAFPGIFRAAVDVRSAKITIEMKLSAGIAISKLIEEKELNTDYIIPDALDSRVPITVARAVAETAIKLNYSNSKDISADLVQENLNGWLLEEKLKNWENIKEIGLKFDQGILKPKF
jgi:malate dehydrogenase (oxaloacetate-decarboxylating)